MTKQILTQVYAPCEDFSVCIQDKAENTSDSKSICI